MKLSRLLRLRIQIAAIEAGHNETIDEAKRQFKKLKENQIRVSANLQDLVYSVDIKTGGENEWQWRFKNIFTLLYIV